MAFLKSFAVGTLPQGVTRGHFPARPETLSSRRAGVREVKLPSGPVWISAAVQPKHESQAHLI